MNPRELREKKLKYNQEQMAEKLGCSRTTVSMIETNERNPSYEIIKGYAVLAAGKKVDFTDFKVSI